MNKIKILQDLANTAWAFAAPGQSDASLLRALAKAAERRAGDFDTQGLANTAWAFAKAGQSDALLFWSLSRAVEQLVGDFSR